MSQKKKVPAIDGWFVADGEIAHLIGTRCKSCGSYFFPRETYFCRNPACRGNDFEEIPLSRTGTLWSFTDNRYPPPAPYVAPDPFEPYIVAAVELVLVKIVVLGQVSSDVSIDDLSAGMKMELVIDSLYEDDENEYLVWKWRPSAG